MLAEEADMLATLGRQVLGLHRAVIDRTAVEGLYVDCGWNYGGFKAVPASGWCMAHLMATDQPHEVARRFRLDRFATGHLLDEEGTGSQHNLH